MTRHGPEFAALWATVCGAPPDAAPKLVLADWLQERGLDPDLERGLRLCAARGWWPDSKNGPLGHTVRAGFRWESLSIARLRWPPSPYPPVPDGVAARLRALKPWTRHQPWLGDRAANAITLVRRLGRAVPAQWRP